MKATDWRIEVSVDRVACAPSDVAEHLNKFIGLPNTPETRQRIEAEMEAIAKGLTPTSNYSRGVSVQVRSNPLKKEPFILKREREIKF